MSSASTITVSFLGTTSGGGPTETRNCSSLVLNMLGDGSLWMVDCAEGTVRQFAQQPADSPRLSINSVNRIFITHMHADHCMGVITLLRNILGIAPDTTAVATQSGRPAKPSIVKVEIFGPVGLRAFIRTVLSLTHTRSADRYRVNELLMPGESSSASPDDPQALHFSEVAGRDIPCGKDGFWRNFVVQNRFDGSQIVMSAGPIVHRDPCIGYLFSERAPPKPRRDFDPEPSPFPRYPPPITIPRTLVILGDTCDPSALIPLITEDPSRIVSLLVHEATDAYIPPHIDPRGTTGRNRNHEIVRIKAIAKGHSTPGMAGFFARQIGAQRLVLNHIGARFPAPLPHAESASFRYRCMREIEDQAMREWQPTNGSRAIAVMDFDRIVIPPIIREAKLPANDSESDEDIVYMGTSSSVAVSRTASVVQHHVEMESRGFTSKRGKGGRTVDHDQQGPSLPRGEPSHTTSPTTGDASNKKRERSGGHDRTWLPNDKYMRDKGNKSGSNGKKARRDNQA